MAAQQEEPLSESDIQAVERYRYLVRTARPEAIEQAHEEAFASLTAQQRRQVLDELSTALPAHERPRSDSAGDLARAATRAELRQPGFMERTFTTADGSLRVGRVLTGSLLTSILGSFLGGALAHEFFGPHSFHHFGGMGGPDHFGGFGGGDFGGGGFGGGDFGGGFG